MYIFKSFKLAVRKDPFSWNTFRKIPFRIPKRSNPFEFLKEFYPEESFFMKGFIPEGIILEGIHFEGMCYARVLKVGIFSDSPFY